MKQFYYTIQTLLRGQGNNMIKIVSLTLGLFVGILLFSRVAFELNYDSYYQEPENLFLTLRTVVSQGEKKEPVCSNYGKLPAAIRENFPDEVEDATLIDLFSRSSLYHEGQEKKDAILATSRSHIFSTLGVKVLSGNVSELDNMDALFISRSLAQSLFADADPIGKTVMINIDYPLTVRGVFEDIPENAEFRFDGVYSFVTRANRFRDERGGWRGDISYTCMVRFRHPEDVEKVAARMPDMMKKYIQYNKDWFEEFSFITPSQFHLQKKESRKIISILSILGFAILLIAGMNNVLISISSLPQRAKSVGVHKCSGASSGNIFGMFLAETGVLVLLSVLFSFLLIINMGELIEDLLGTSLASLFAWDIIWIPLLTVVVLFLLAGGIPGKLFSRIPVTQVFRHYTDGKRGWKRSLLFVQFTGTSFVLGLLLVTLLQYSHLMNGDMGIKIPGLVEAETWMSGETVEHVKDELLRQPMVDGVSASTHSVLGEYWTRGLIGNDGKRIATLNFNMCDYDYPNVMGIRITEGTTIKKKGDLLVNKELVRLMKWTDGAVGKSVSGVEGTIVGVFDDIRNRSFYSSQSPIVLIADKESANHTINVRLKEPYDENLKRLNECVAKTFPNVALNFNSVDSMIREGYKSVYRFRNAVWISSCFILLIVITGLIGYVNGETQRRSKEIAIRKVNGAEASGILKLLIYDILNISVISVLIGTAASYFTGQIWLEQFSERIDMDLLLFIGIALLVLLVIVACVVVKAWHVANENPVKSIKAE